MGKRIALLFMVIATTFSLFGCSRMPTGANTNAATTTAHTEATQTETIPAETETVFAETTLPETEPMDIAAAWTPLCEEFIYLRSLENKAQTIAQIPVGELLKLDAWEGKYALVTYQGAQGYVTANYIKPLDAEYFTKRLTVLSPTAQYTYDQMVADMAALQAAYPDSVTVSGIGKSELGRNIPVMLVGNPQAPNHVLLQGAMHAREHCTAWLLMAIIDHSLSAKLLSDNVCYHVIPMSNPDGVCISQSQTLNDSQTEIYQRDIACGYTGYDSKTYAQKWKANALGVDLNRNFPSGWENSLERPLPSSERFRGDSPLCAAESKALANYTQSRHFSATFSFHSHGSVLYYAYGSKQPVNDLSYSLALAVQQSTGYRPIGGYDGTSGAGYKDWAIDALEIPSITVEIGSNSTPLEDRDLYNTFARFENFIPAIDQWLNNSY